MVSFLKLLAAIPVLDFLVFVCLFAFTDSHPRKEKEPQGQPMHLLTPCTQVPAQLSSSTVGAGGGDGWRARPATAPSRIQVGQHLAEARLHRLQQRVGQRPSILQFN